MIRNLASIQRFILKECESGNEVMRCTIVRINGGPCDSGVQISELSEAAELKRDGTIEIIRGKVPKKAT